MLLAADRGVELDLEIRGHDARDAMEALSGLLTGSSWAGPVAEPAAG
jgi:phosphotransferase system HPr-like phosphotransfer protein